jgi:hypothetical protein
MPIYHMDLSDMSEEELKKFAKDFHEYISSPHSFCPLIIDKLPDWCSKEKYEELLKSG